MSPNIIQPCFQVVKSFLTGEVEAEEDNVGSLVKDASDGAEGLLARRVPNLQLHDLLVQLDDEGSELYSNCHLVLHFELLVHDSRQKTTLSNSCSTTTTKTR